MKFNGAINGDRTQITVTLTNDGSLTFLRLNGKGHLHWRQADASDPEPLIERGTVNDRAEFRRLPPVKK